MAESSIDKQLTIPSPHVGEGKDGGSPLTPPSPTWREGEVIYILSLLIRMYQWQAPFWGPRCRFYPSCSEYMRDALQEFGFWTGLKLGTLRILKCHPWHPGGVDFIRTSHGK